MIKPGDLVMIADDKWTVPGALSAIKYFQRLQHDYSGKTMIVLEVREREKIRQFYNQSPPPPQTRTDDVALGKSVTRTGSYTPLQVFGGSTL